MKKLTSTLVALISAATLLAQTSDFSYYVQRKNGETVVRKKDQIVSTPIELGVHAQLLPNGEVNWADNSKTILHDGDCIDEQGIIYSANSNKDFSGNENALNHIHLLPEATITGERITKSDSTNDNLEVYLREAYLDLEENDYMIEVIKEKLLSFGSNSNKLLFKQLANLESENQELKADFDLYVHFGKGNWRLFKNQFNADLKPLKDDLNILKVTIS